MAANNTKRRTICRDENPRKLTGQKRVTVRELRFSSSSLSSAPPSKMPMG
ncbi:hypothetical protein F2Q68_00036764 [Brassica cretica]|uniref:Uncharacterized protein n=1 Tax=Brassica cretica TaxID=69181 RepID=A0A8S9HAY7_BRACR|nr:hypothetical protein F2Q68_00036764 [Brassica cretica]